MICPSSGPLLTANRSAASTAARSRSTPAANSRNSANPLCPGLGQPRLQPGLVALAHQPPGPSASSRPRAIAGQSASRAEGGLVRRSASAGSVSSSQRVRRGERSRTGGGGVDPMRGHFRVRGGEQPGGRGVHRGQPDRAPYPPEFRARAVELARTSGPSPCEGTAAEGTAAPGAGGPRPRDRPRDAAAVAEAGGHRRRRGRRPDERRAAELARLRRENAVLREEREILKKAAVCFAREGTMR